MKELRGHIRSVLIGFIVLFLILGAYIGYSVTTNGTRWFVSSYNPVLKQQKENVKAGSILDRNYVVLAESDDDGDRIYNKDATVRKAMSHTVGDPYGIASAGIESFRAKYLLGFSGNIFERIYQSITMDKRIGDNVVCTVDSKLASYIYNKMGDRSGAVVVMNYKTGEILASVSTPGFDPKTIKEPSEDDAGSQLVNRATMGRYTPGSVFKLVTAAAVLEYKPELASKTYTCTGEVDYGEDGRVTCSGGAVHGELDLNGAVTKSCNCVFAQIAQDLGRNNLKKMAEKLGYNEDFLFDDLMIYQSSYDVSDARDIDYAWSSVGQYKDTASPMHVCMITSAIANDGVMMEPKLIKSVMNYRNFEYIKMTSNTYRRCMSQQTAEQLQEMMVNVVKNGTGKSAAVKGVTVAGKTGTAEVSDNKETKPHAWFTGFIQDEEYPYAIVVMIENAGGGGSQAAPIAASVLKKTMELIK